MPKDIKSTNRLLAESFIDSMIGDKKTKGDEIEPTSSPLDFIPYESAASFAKTILANQLKSNAVKQAAESAMVRVENLYGAPELPTFDSQNIKHVNSIKPQLEKLLPHSMDDDYTNGELIHSLMSDPGDHSQLLQIPEVQQAIENTGYSPIIKPDALSSSAASESPALNPNTPDSAGSSFFKGGKVWNKAKKYDVGGAVNSGANPDNSDANPMPQSELPDQDSAEGMAAKGWGNVGNYIKGQWDQGGQNIHNALQQAQAGNYQPLGDAAISTAMSTLGPSEGAAEDIGENAPTFYSKLRKTIEAKIHPTTPGVKVHSLELTPELKRAVLKEGQPLFYKGGLVKKPQSFARGGQVKRFDDGGDVQSPTSNSQAVTQVFDRHTGALGTLPHDQVQEAVGSGNYSFPQGQPVQVFNPDGQLGTISPDQASGAFNNGFKYATPSAINEYNLQQKYGEGFGNAAKSFGLGAGNALSFGALNQGLVHSGMMSPEDIQQTTQRNPGSYVAGTVAGLGAGIALTPSLAAANAALETAVAANDVAGIAKATQAIQTARGLTAYDALNPISAVSKIGQGVTKMAQDAMPGASSIAGKILSNGAATGLGSAVEGAAFGAGNMVGEQALGDPNLNAQAIAAHIGASALFGGALGSIIGAGEVAVPASVQAAKSAFSNAKAKYWDAAGSPADIAANWGDKISSIFSGQEQADIKLARENRGAHLNTPEAVEEFSGGLASTLQNQYDSMNRASKDAFSDARPIETEILNSQITNPEAAYQTFAKVHSELSNVIDTMRAEPEIYPQNYPRKLEMLRDRFLGKPGDMPEITEDGVQTLKLNPEEVLPGTPGDIYNSLNDLKQNIDGQIKYGKIPSPADQDAQSLIKGFRGLVKDSLENQDVFGEAGARQAAFNDSFVDYKSARDELQKKFMTKSVSKSGEPMYKIDPVKVNSYLNQINDIRGEARSNILKNFDTASQRHLDQIEQSYANLPYRMFNKEHTQDFLTKSLDMQHDFQQKANVQQALNRLKGGSLSALAEEAANAVMIGAAHAAGVSFPVASTVASAYSILANPFLTIQRLAKMEEMIGKVNRVMSKGAKALIKNSDTGGTLPAFLANKAVQYNSQEDYQKKVNKINETLGNPYHLMDNLQKSTDSIEKHAPNTASAVQATALRAMQFLQSKIPNTGPDTPLGPKMLPNKADIVKFNRYYEAVQHPLDVFRQMKSGMLTMEALEAVHVVYPQLYDKMKADIFESIASSKDKPIPYKTKLQLSLFMNQDMDLTTNPLAIQANQAALGNAQQQQKQQDQAFMTPKSTVKGISSISAASRYMTPLQQVAQRGSSK